MADEKAIALDKLARALNKLRDTGLPLNDWQAGKKYKVGYTVIQSGKLYRCIIAHISTSTFDTAKWEELSSGRGISTWKENTTYDVNDIVIYSNIIWKCVVAHTSSTTFDESKWVCISGGEISNGMEIIPLWEGSFSFNNSTQGAAPTSSTPMIELNDYISNFEYIYVVTELSDGTDSHAVTVPVSLVDNIRIGMVAANTNFSTASLAKYDDTHFYILFNNTLGWAVANVVKICGIRKAKPIVSSGMKYETLWEGESGSLNDSGNTTINLSKPVTGYKKLGLSLASQSTSGYRRSYYQELDTNIFMDLINNGSNGDSIQCGFSGNTSYYFEIGKDSNVSQLSISYGHNIITKVTGISEGVVIPTGVQAARVTLWEGLYNTSNQSNDKSSFVSTQQLSDSLTSYDQIEITVKASSYNINNDVSQLFNVSDALNHDNMRIGFYSANTFYSCITVMVVDDKSFGISWIDVSSGLDVYITKIVGIKYIQPDSYSTEEQLIGTWIDGKPLYQKTVEFTTPSETSVQEYSYLPGIPFSSIDNIISIDGWCKRADGWRVPHLFHVGNKLFFSIDWNKSNQKIYFYVLENNDTGTANQPATLTFRYTKTTN